MDKPEDFHPSERNSFRYLNAVANAKKAADNKDPRYKSGTSLTKTAKEEERDRLIDVLPPINEELAESFDTSLMKLDVWGLRQLGYLIVKGKRLERESHEPTKENS